jgi:DNA repair exonuclease SbcCD ATPase subunit
MLAITIHSVVIHNFRSFVDEELVFPLTDGLKFLGGDNRVEPRLGANAAGKTTLLDAIHWCFFGVGIKGTRTSDLISWGAKKAEVTVKLLRGDETYDITRFGPPTKVKLNGELVEQVVINRLLGLTMLRFAHSVLFGQGEELFPDLDGPKRAELFDQVLDLSVWVNCLDAASSQITKLENQVNEYKQDISFLNGSLAQLPTDEQLQKEIANWEVTRQNSIVQLEESLSSWDIKNAQNISELEQRASEWKVTQNKKGEGLAAQLEKLEVEHTSIVTARQRTLDRNSGAKVSSNGNLARDLSDWEVKGYRIEAAIKQVRDQLRFWEKNNTCPTCGQIITDELKREKEQQAFSVITKQEGLEKEAREKIAQFRTATVAADKAEKEQIKARAEQESIERDLSRLQKQMAGIEEQATLLLAEIEDDNNPYNSQIASLKKTVNPFYLQISQEREKINPYVAKLESVRRERIEAELKLETIVNESKSVEGKILAIDYWHKHGFKRIRLFFVQRILTALEIEIAGAISASGLVGWGVTLATESETKSGTVKLGVAIKVKSPTSEGPWEGWSGGESQRLRIALAKGVAGLIQRAAGVFWTQEFLDEPTSWLSSEGIEDLLESLRYRAEILNKQIWIADHRALTFSGFSEIFVVRKDVDGSKVLRVAGMAN